jgi:AcrR family transcriptional regulator
VRFKVPTPDSVTALILDAALEQFAILGLSRTSLTDIARKAGIDRATIYRRIGGGTAVVDAALALEGRRVIDRIRQQIEPVADINERVERAFVTTVQIMRSHPILVRALQIDKAGALLAISEITAPVMEAAVDFVLDEIGLAHDNEYRFPIADEAVAQIVVRIIHSLVLFPDAPPVLTTEADLTDYARTTIAPLLRLAGATNYVIQCGAPTADG